MIDIEPDPSEAIPSAILAGGLLPFLAVMAWGCIFYYRGDGVVEATIVDLFVFSPILLSLGIATGVLYYQSQRSRRFVLGIDFFLMSLVFAGLVLIPAVVE